MSGTYYDALKAKWPSVPGATAADKLVNLNAEIVPGPDRDVGVGEVLAYLALRGITSSIEDWLEGKDTAWAGQHPDEAGARTAARELMRLINTNQVRTIHTSDPTVFGAIQTMLAAMVQVGGMLTQQEADGLLALCHTSQSWWQANGYTTAISEADLAAAGLS